MLRETDAPAAAAHAARLTAKREVTISSTKTSGTRLHNTPVTARACTEVACQGCMNPRQTTNSHAKTAPTNMEHRITTPGRTSHRARGWDAVPTKSAGRPARRAAAADVWASAEYRPPDELSQAGQACGCGAHSPHCLLTRQPTPLSSNTAERTMHIQNSKSKPRRGTSAIWAKERSPEVVPWCWSVTPSTNIIFWELELPATGPARSFLVHAPLRDENQAWLQVCNSNSEFWGHHTQFPPGPCGFARRLRRPDRLAMRPLRSYRGDRRESRPAPPRSSLPTSAAVIPYGVPRIRPEFDGNDSVSPDDSGTLRVLAVRIPPSGPLVPWTPHSVAVTARGHHVPVDQEKPSCGQKHERDSGRRD